jgi:large subunit ribosomal protein L23
MPTRPRSRRAVQNIFGVKVLAVNTLVQKGQDPRVPRPAGQRNDIKKAFVRLAEGQSIDVSTGI